MGKEYLVEGAQLCCIHGSKKTLLKIPKGHGYTSKGKQKANVLDCKANVNIPFFGNCDRNKKNKQCKGYIALKKKWESISASSTRPEKVNGQEALTMDSVLLCERGGIIMPLTSGQGYKKGVDWEAFRKRLMKLLEWAGGNDKLYFLFGGDPINLNTGNFIYEKEDLKMEGRSKFSFRLFYNAMEGGKGGCLGKGWHHNQEAHIQTEEKGMLTLCLGDGRKIPYRKGIGKLYTPLFGDRGILWEEEEGYVYRTMRGE